MITFKMTMKQRIDGNVKITIATSIDAFSNTKHSMKLYSLPNSVQGGWPPLMYSTYVKPSLQ